MSDAPMNIEGVDEVERLAASAGVDMRSALAHAGIAKTTWWRWKGGRFEPQARSLRRLRSAIREIAAGSAA